MHTFRLSKLPLFNASAQGTVELGIKSRSVLNGDLVRSKDVLLDSGATEEKKKSELRQ